MAEFGWKQVKVRQATYDALATQASSERRSLATVLAEALRQYIEREAKREAAAAYL